MNTQVALISVREKVESVFEGLMSLAASAVVLSGTVAICFPTLTLGS